MININANLAISYAKKLASAVLSVFWESINTNWEDINENWDS